MSATLKLATGTELPLISVPMISGGIAAFQVTPSATVTAESVTAAVKDYANTQSFQIVTDSVVGPIMPF